MTNYKSHNEKKSFELCFSYLIQKETLPILNYLLIYYSINVTYSHLFFSQGYVEKGIKFCSQLDLVEYQDEKDR